MTNQRQKIDCFQSYSFETVTQPLLSIPMIILVSLLSLSSRDAVANTNFAIVLLPDTQLYAANFPEYFIAQTQWIKDHRDKLNIRFAIHLGDIVHENTVQEWDVANRAMGILENFVPYSVAPGNHDMGRNTRGAIIRVTEKFNIYFPPRRFEGKSWYGGYLNLRNDNNYCYFHSGNLEFMVISLEYGPRDEVLEWANEIVMNHRTKKIIVMTHCYMYFDDTRVGPGDTWNPQSRSKSWNDGELIWEKFVQHHPNIVMVVSGHIKGDGAGRLSSIGIQGNTVHQILANYQILEETGGSGWLRIITFSPDDRRIIVECYSPVLNEYWRDPEHTFELGWNLDN